VKGQEIQWEMITEMDAANSIWTITSSLFSTPYWERLWIIQEIALTPSVFFYYGEQVFSVDDILRLGYIAGRGFAANKFSANFESDTDVVKMVLTMSHACHRLIRLQPPLIMDDSHLLKKSVLHSADIMRFAQSSKATDRRDKAFGLLALLPEAISARISPDYSPSFSIQEAYTMFSKACFEADGTLCFLARLNKRPSLTTNLPS
jgi:hypothetical protein